MNIARRFLFSPKSHSIVNLIARVSVVALAVPVVALVLVLSLHNGLSDYIHSMYAQIDAPIEVRAAKGAFFELDSTQRTSLTRQVGVVSTMVEGNVLAVVGDRQSMVSIRGVDSLYHRVTGIERTISRGEWRLEFGDMPRAVLGAGVSYNLAYSLVTLDPIELYALQQTPVMFSYLPIPFFNESKIVAGGVFALDKATDASIIYAPLGFVRQLLGVDSTQVSSLLIEPRGDVSQGEAKEIVTQILGTQVVSRTSQEQRGDMFRVINVEKWIIMLMLIFVALIAAISLSGCMLMMLSEKQAATDTLAVIGMSGKRLRAIFVRLGMMVVGIGVMGGMVVGVVLVVVQHYFGVLSMGGESFLIEAYPVRIAVGDLALILVAVGAIGYAIVRLTVNSVIKK